MEGFGHRALLLSPCQTHSDSHGHVCEAGGGGPPGTQRPLPFLEPTIGLWEQAEGSRAPCLLTHRASLSCYEPDTALGPDTDPCPHGPEISLNTYYVQRLRSVIETQSQMRQGPCPLPSFCPSIRSSIHSLFLLICYLSGSLLDSVGN